MLRTATHLLETFQTRTDRVLIEHYLIDRDERTFAELVRRHVGMVRRVASDVTPHLADDIAQATFSLFQKKIETVSGRESAAGWLCQSARRLALKARTTSARQRTRETRAAKSIQSLDPVDELSLREVRAIVVEELNAMNESHRLPLLLVYFDGATYEQVASRLGCSLSTVQRRLETGRNTLAARLRRRGFGTSSVFAILATLSATVVSPANVSTVIGKLSPIAAKLLQPSGWSTYTGPLAATVIVVVAGAGLGAGFHMADEPKPVTVKQAQMIPVDRSIKDILGDPLPPGAVARLGTNRLRPGIETPFLAFNGDGKKLLSWSESHQVPSRCSIWNIATGQELHRAELINVGMKAFRWLADGSAVLVIKTAGDEHWVIDPTDPNAMVPRGKAPLNSAALEPGEILPVAISPDGKRIATGRYSGVRMRLPAAPGAPPMTVPVQVWNTVIGKRLSDLPLRWSSERIDDCLGLTFSPNGHELIGVFLGNMPRTTSPMPPPDGAATVVRWNAETGVVVNSFSIPNPTLKPHYVTRHTFHQQLPLAVTPDGSGLWIGSDDGAIRLWNLKEGNESQKLQVTKNGELDSVQLSPDGKTISAIVSDPDWYSSGNGFSSVRSRMWSHLGVWNCTDGKSILDVDQVYEIGSHAISPNGTVAAYAASGNEISLRDVATGKPLLTHLSRTQDFSAVAISLDGKRAVSGDGNGRVMTWDLQTGRQLESAEFSSSKKQISIRQFSSDGKIGYAIVDGRIGRIDSQTGGVTPLHDDQFLNIQYTILGASPTGTVAALRAGQVISYLAEGKPGPAFIPPPGEKGETSSPYRAVWSADGKRFFMWGQYLVEMKRPGMKEGETVFSNTGSWMASYDAGSGKQLQSWKSNTFDPFVVIPTNRPDRILVAGHAHGELEKRGIPFRENKPNYSESIRLFDAETLKPIRSFAAPVEINESHWSIHEAALSDDNRTLAISDNKGLIRLYEMTTGRIRKQFAGHGGSAIKHLVFTPDGRRLLSTGNDRTGLVWDTTISDGPLPTSAEQAWTDLASPDASKGYAAEHFFREHSTEGISLFRKQLFPVESIGPERIIKLITALDASDYDDREFATKFLLAFADQFQKQLKVALTSTTSAEVRKRLQAILDSSDESKPLAGDTLRAVRAIEVLERIDNADAKSLLRSLSHGAASAHVTMNATSSLMRLEKLESRSGK